MPRLSEEKRTRLENLSVALLLELRREYLAAGASPLKHWDQMQSRMLGAARTTDSVPEWLSTMCRSLQLGAPRSSTWSAASALHREVTECGPAAWLDLVERECSYLMAKARLESETRKAQREYYPDDSDHPGVEATTEAVEPTEED
jgi:hypothetical protein